MKTKDLGGKKRHTDRPSRFQGRRIEAFFFFLFFFFKKKTIRGKAHILKVARSTSSVC